MTKLRTVGTNFDESVLYSRNKNAAPALWQGGDLLFRVDDMDVELGERNADTVFVEAELDVFLHGKEHGPVVRRVAPDAAEQINAAGGMGADIDLRHRLTQHLFVLQCRLHHDLLRLGNIVGVADGKRQIDTAGLFGGKVDLIIMRILDIVSAIPGMLLAVVISAALGSGFYKCVLAIGISGIPGYCRMLRGSIMATRDNEYVEAATAINCSKFRIIAKHVFPNAMSPIIVQATMSIASGITMAAGLAYIGLGVQPPNPEWGAMLSDAKNYIRDYPYLVVIPGAVIMLTVLAMNLIGDALRDAMDPKLKH